MDEDERYALGAYSTLEAATRAAQAIVDVFLLAARQLGRTGPKNYVAVFEWRICPSRVRL